MRSLRGVFARNRARKGKVDVRCRERGPNEAIDSSKLRNVSIRVLESVFQFEGSFSEKKGSSPFVLDRRVSGKALAAC